MQIEEGNEFNGRDFLEEGNVNMDKSHSDHWDLKEIIPGAIKTSF